MVPPPWVSWDHSRPKVWPVADDLDIDLNEIPALEWLDGAAERVRRRLRVDTGTPVLGHVDWETHNIGWRDGQPHVVYDWDSVAIRTEIALAGSAATVFASSGTTIAATIAQTEEFLDHYQRRRGQWQTSDRELAWAAGLWVLLYNAKKETAGGGAGYLQQLESELSQRMRHTGA
jgi:hypothetical protein